MRWFCIQSSYHPTITEGASTQRTLFFVPFISHSLESLLVASPTFCALNGTNFSIYLLLVLKIFTSHYEGRTFVCCFDIIQKLRMVKWIELDKLVWEMNVDGKKKRDREWHTGKKQQHHIMLCVRKEMGPLAVYSVLESRVGKQNFQFYHMVLCSW